jgi:hypothetical protein
MSKEHLIPFNEMDKQKHIDLSKKGGTRQTQAKKYAARLRELKKKGLSDDNIRRISDIIEDPACSALDMKLFIENLRTQNLSNVEKIKLGNLMVSWHKSHHGEKHGIISTNLNFEIKQDLEKWFSHEENKQI